MSLWSGKQGAVNETNLISQITKNLAYLLEANVSDPISATRPSSAQKKFVSTVFPDTEIYPPQLVVEVLLDNGAPIGLGSTQPTGYSVFADIHVLAKTAPQLDTVTQDVLKALRSQKNALISWGMHPTASFIRGVTTTRKMEVAGTKIRMRTVQAFFKVYVS